MTRMIGRGAQRELRSRVTQGESERKRKPV